MIKIMYSASKTNAFYPTPWHFMSGAYRGGGYRYDVLLPVVARGYRPKFEGSEPTSDGFRCPQVSFDSNFCRIDDEEGLLVVPCSPEQDEKIMLLTLRGGLSGFYSRIEAVDAQILFKKGDNIHGVPTEHIVARLTNPKGYIVAETGRRSGTGIVEVFSWEGYKPMLPEEERIWRKRQSRAVSRA